MADMNVAVILKLVDELSGPAHQARGALGGIGDAAARLAKLGLAAGVAGVTALGGTLVAGTNQAIAFEAAMADVAKVVDFDPAPLGDALLELSRRLAKPVEGLVAIAAAAGQAGMKTEEDILRFTEMAAKVGVAFDLPAEFVGGALSKIQTALRTTVEETGLLADTINHLSNNSAASSEALLRFTQNAAALGQTYGFSKEGTVAVGNAMISAGADADKASTSFIAAGRALNAGASATKAVVDGYRAIGLEATEVARRVHDDGAEVVLQDILNRIQTLAPEKRASVTSQIFGDEGVRSLGPLVSNTKLLADSLGLVAERGDYAGSVIEEFERASSTTANTMALVKQNIAALTQEAGERLLPTVSRALEALLSFLQGIDGQDNALFRLADGIARVAEGFSGLGDFTSSGVGAAVVGVLERLAAYAGGIWDGLASGLGGVADAFAGLGDALNLLLGIGGDTGRSLADLLGDPEQWSQIGHILGTVVAGALEAVVKGLTVLVEGAARAREGLSSFLDWLGELADRIGAIEIDWSFLQPPDWVSGIGDGIASGVRGAWSGLSEGFGRLVGDAGEVARLAAAVPSTVTAVDLPSLERAATLSAEVGAAMTSAAAIDVAPALADLSLLGDRARELAPVVRAALAEAESALAAADWTAAGARLMDSLAAGARSRAGALAAVVREAAAAAANEGLSSALDRRRRSALQDGVER